MSVMSPGLTTKLIFGYEDKKYTKKMHKLILD